MKFLIINSNNRVKGGNDFVAYEQHKILSSLFESKMFTEGKFGLPFTNYFFSFINLIRIFYCLQSFKPDFIFVHSFSGKLSNSILFALRFFDIKKYFFVHDYKLICPISSMYRWDEKKSSYVICQECPSKKSISYVLRNRCNRSSYIFSFINYLDFKIAQFLSLEIVFDKFIFVSKYTKDVITSYSKIISDKSKLLYNSVLDINDGSPIAFNEKKYDFVFIGRLSKEKGIIEFCEFCEQNNLNVKLLVIGEGNLRKEIENRFPQFVECVGFKSGSEKIQLIKLSKFLIFPSLWLENNPIVLLESQSLSIPALAHSIGGVPEIIHNNFNGFLYSNQEDLLVSIKAALSITEEEYSILSNNSRSTYKKSFSPEVFIGFIKNVIAESAK